MNGNYDFNIPKCFSDSKRSCAFCEHDLSVKTQVGIAFCYKKRRVLQAAFWYGLVVHFRIYPIIHALPILMILDPHVFRHGQKPRLQYWNRR
ncbi:hypothetical protein ACFX1R_004562 [Malus domestica]